MARLRRCDRSSCGHPHVPRRPTSNQPIPYFKADCWTELPFTYLTVAARCGAGSRLRAEPRWEAVPADAGLG